MTGVDLPDPASQARWCARLAGVLSEMSAQVGDLADRILEHWPDDHGRERAERATLLHRELGRAALAADELSSALARSDSPTALPQVPMPTGPPAQRRHGVRLGGTETRREDPEQGMRVAQLPGP